MMDTLHNLSGGLDSVYCMYDYLTKNPDKTLLVFHCNLESRVGRHLKEREATDKALQWFQDNGLTNYKYLEGSFSYGDEIRMTMDDYIIAVFTGILLRDRKKYRSIKYMINCAHKTSTIRLGPRIHNYRKRVDEIITVMSAGDSRVAGRTLERVYPILHMMKSEVVAACPPDLLVLTWSCRKPRDDGSRCGKCHACRQIAGEIIPDKKAKR
jgi:7-cyano-7-deazaguanine synthase in queuosine biosynthesis